MVVSLRKSIGSEIGQAIVCLLTERGCQALLSPLCFRTLKLTSNFQAGCCMDLQDVKVHIWWCCFYQIILNFVRIKVWVVTCIPLLEGKPRQEIRLKGEELFPGKSDTSACSCSAALAWSWSTRFLAKLKPSLTMLQRYMWQCSNSIMLYTMHNLKCFALISDIREIHWNLNTFDINAGSLRILLWYYHSLRICNFNMVSTVLRSTQFPNSMWRKRKWE